MLFQLLDGYFSMLDKCIEENQFDTNRFAKGFSMLNFFLSVIFKETLDSIQVNEGINLNIETPTYNHELLNILLSYFDDILSSDNNENESYQLVIRHFSPIYSDCITELFEKSEVVKADYLKIQFKSFLDTYFEQIYDFTSSINDINERLVEKLAKEPNRLIKRDLFEVCWKYADDDIFVNGYNIPNDLKDQRENFIRDVVSKIVN